MPVPRYVRMPIAPMVAVLLVLSVTDGHALAEEPGQTAAEPFDVLIRGGTLYDGSGSAPVKGDLAIRGDKIITLGNLSAAAADFTDANWWRARGLSSAQVETFKTKCAPSDKAPPGFKEDFER